MMARTSDTNVDTIIEMGSDLRATIEAADQAASDYMGRFGDHERIVSVQAETFWSQGVGWVRLLTITSDVPIFGSEDC
jgi:hypothetical protein